ncbi:hypothetical protein ABL78_6814 [Leptomonas seymouri]|uniref:Uncharacterized protein n=1 Tax=Leptomonas seymouri TaxID=5684 RepID=A0A0N1IHU8_LEPSE|nr:hypothetical protein ABL78_6814 [Leptomonas seymouri]|eukprot:KPI84140.1 hypothetical protein ABL78_6814 [Leptomonas seymouri]
MLARPRDLHTAAFHDDTERLRQLIVAAGVYTGRWQPPCHIETSPANRAVLEADLPDDGAADGAARGERSHRGNEPPQEGDAIVSEDVADELAELISEDEMVALAAHPELQRVMQAYALDVAAAEDEEDAANDDNGDGGAEGNDNELLDEDEEEAAEADRLAQQHDFLIYRCLLAEQRHRESIAQRLQQHGLLQTSTTPPVNMVSYGILFSCRAQSISPPRSEELNEDPADGTSDAPAAPGASISLQVRWQPSKRSRYGGTPLHWAVLSRAHAAVKFLVEHGADETLGLQEIGNASGAAAAESGCDSAAAATKVLCQLTPAVMAIANESLPTLEVLETALAARAADQENRKAFYAALENRMQRRKERYAQRRQNALARRAQQVQAQREAEEREREREENERAAEGQEEEEEEYDGEE